MNEAWAKLEKTAILPAVILSLKVWYQSIKIMKRNPVFPVYKKTNEPRAKQEKS